MNLFSGLKGRHAMQTCHRCGNQLQSDTPRDVIDEGVYHIYCGWKIRRMIAEKEAVRNIGESYDDTLDKGRGSNPNIPTK